MRTPVRRFTRAALAAAILVLAAGCGIPATSQVQQGLAVGAPVLPPVRFEFEAPQRGASPEQIVRGFLAASWSAEDDFRSARAYLTTAASAAWDPRRSVTVYPSTASLTVAVKESGTVSLETEEIASLDASGRYQSYPAGARHSARLRLEQVTGEWRIASLDPDFGLWLSRFYFERAYRSFEVAYVDPARRRLVSDHRWFPVGSGLATTLARALIEPVPAYLAPAVHSGFPAGTSLAVDSVPVAHGQASVDLTSSMVDVRAEDRRAAWAQALRTMRQVPEVSSVVLQAQGSPIEVVGVSGIPVSSESLGYLIPAPPGGPALRRNRDRLALLEGHDLAHLDDAPAQSRSAGLPDIGEDWDRIAAAPNLVEFAAVDGDRLDLSRWRGEAAVAYPRFGRELTAPAYDRLGRLWVGGRSPEGDPRMWTVDVSEGSMSASPRVISAPWLVGRTVQAVRPAPDGRRAVVITTDAQDRTQIGVSGVVRGSDGAVTALTRPWTIGGDILQATQVSWVDDATLALIGRREARGPMRPLLQHVGGSTQELATVPQPRAIATLGGERGLVVVSDDGFAYGRVGGGWQRIGPMRDVVVPGD